MKFTNALGFVRDRVVKRNIQMGDGQRYRWQAQRMDDDDPTKTSDVNPESFWMAIKHMPRLLYLAFGGIFGYSIAFLGPESTLYVFLFGVVFAVTMRYLGKKCQAVNEARMESAAPEPSDDYSVEEELLDIEL